MQISHYLTNPQIKQRKEPFNSKRNLKQTKLGKLSVNVLLCFFIPLLIFACFFSYFMAVSKKEAKPFPHTTITNMSRFYPQDLVFRYIMLPAGGFVSLVYLVLFKWLKKIKEVINFPFSTQQWLYPLGQLSILGFYGAVSTIDGGNLPLIHIIGAIFFFLMLFLISSVVTLVLREMHKWSTLVISRGSISIKSAISFYILCVTAYSIWLENSSPSNQDQPSVVIAEWNLVIGGLIWLLTFVWQWKGVNLVLIGKMEQTYRKLEQN